MKRNVKELLVILPHIENFVEWAESLPLPQSVGGQTMPDFNDMTLGQYIELSHIEQPETLLFEAIRVMSPSKLTDDVIGDFDAEEVVGYVWALSKRVEQLNGMFEAISPELSPEEQAAQPPQIGVMGLIDFASTRFVKTYADSEKLNVYEVFEAMRIANEMSEYKKRLQQIYNEKAKRP